MQDAAKFLIATSRLYVGCAALLELGTTLLDVPEWAAKIPESACWHESLGNFKARPSDMSRLIAFLH
eukprot:9019949-Prorocentrum_lima.AAC.1